MKRFILYLFTLLPFLVAQSQTQYPPISPKWIFEPWAWEDATNTESSTWDLVNGYIDNNIPISAVIIDSPWELPIASGYNTFLFDPASYSQPKSFIQQLNNKGIHVILWITGVMTTDCPLYQTALNDGYFVNDGATTSFWKGSGYASHIDFFNSAAVQYWEGLMNRVFDSLSVDGWKVDESDNELPVSSPISTYQGSKTRRQYSDAYYSEMYNYIYKKRGAQAMIMARPYCKEVDPPDYTPYYFAPISVNTAGWVGDKYSTWAGLTLALNNMFISASAGYAAVGSDIGGYIDNTTSQDKDLFLRWAQMGSLMPIMENGGKSDDHHKPWLFDANTTQIYRYFAELHHELVPYLYSYDIAAHLTGTSIVRPFGNRDNTDTTQWDGDWKYMLGDNLFVAAIYQDVTNRTITFPTGSSWIDYWSDDSVYQGGTTETINYPLNHFPIFIKPGAIIPLNVDNNVTNHGSTASNNYLTLLVYPDGLSSYQYYTSSSSSTTVKCSQSCGKYTVSFSQKTGSVIIRLKTNVEPQSVSVSGGQSLTQVNSYANFESAQSGWFYGKVASGENNYAWIKFTNSTDTVYVTTSAVSNITPTNYVLSKLNVGNNYYVDRTYTLLTIPDKYKGLYMIETANGDKTNNNLNFHFDICGSADIYIAYDHRLAASTPSWITNNYISTGETISANDDTPNQTLFDIWKRSDVPAGTVSFGANNGISESSMYFVFYKSYTAVYVNVKVFLQGPYAGNGTMNTTLQQNSLIPHSQPYSSSPWSYNGSESVSSVPSGVVDWILVQLRTGTAASTIADERACFLKSNGTVTDLDGISPVSFNVDATKTYYIVVEHRNHLAVISKNAETLSNNTLTCDFTDTSKVYSGASALVLLNDGKYGMIGGNSNADNKVYVDDYNATGSKMFSQGYFSGDLNMNGTVYVDDYNLTGSNMFKTSKVTQ
jgi:hypothetical protein